MIIGATYSDKETGFGSVSYKSKKELLDKILSGKVKIFLYLKEILVELY